MSSITALKDRLATSTWKLVLLTVATAGLYPILWLAQTTNLIKDVTKTSVVADHYAIWMIGVAGWSGVLVGAKDRDLNEFGTGMSLGLTILYIVWAFKAKKAIEEYAINQHRVDPKMNSFYTFFLNIFYVCYCINDLPEEQRKQQVLAGQGDKPSA